MPTKKIIIGWFSLMFLFSIQMIIYSHFQPQVKFGDGRGDDGVIYGSVTDQILNGQLVRGPSPFVYRIGASWISAGYAKFSGTTTEFAYRVTDTIFMVFILTILYFLAIQFCSPVFAIIAISLYSLPWWSYTRLIWLEPILNDLPWFFLTLTGIYFVVWQTKKQLEIWQCVFFAFLCFLASLSRETGLLLPFIWISNRTWFSHFCSLDFVLGDIDTPFILKLNTLIKDIAQFILYISASILALLLTRSVAENTGGYTFFAAAIGSISKNTLWHFVLSFCLAYGGPLLALFIIYHRYWREKVRFAPVLVFYWGVIVILAFLGGVDTLRFLSWASPIALIFIAHLSQKLWFTYSDGFNCIIARILLLINFSYYIVMIHPFEGYFNTYAAWRKWGGWQFSNIHSVLYLIPCLILLIGSVVLGRRIIPDARGDIGNGS